VGLFSQQIEISASGALTPASLQDTLGNIMGGMALQMERSIAVDDWIGVNDVEGIVREIRWRQTSIETRSRAGP
jgi:small-conductance mechanosensitive channel